MPARLLATASTACLLALLGSAAPAMAHVGIRPRQSTPGAEQRYTVRVPTEGAVATSSVHLEVPEGVTVVSVEAVQGSTYEVQRDGQRIVGVTWTKTIPPKEVGEFFLVARNPDASRELVWRAHQHFADGTVTHWVGRPGDGRPAPRVTLAPTQAPAAAYSDGSQVQSASRRN